MDIFIFVAQEMSIIKRTMDDCKAECSAVHEQAS